MSDLCQKLHEYFNKLKRFYFPFNIREIPKNGVYILFQKGEKSHSFDRIVRIGTHTGNNQLRPRLEQHFVKENKDRSIFRKNIGRCFLNKSNNSFLAKWEIDWTSKNLVNLSEENVEFQKRLEKEISNYIQENFSFCVFETDAKKDRFEIEAKLISTIHACDQCEPSQDWLGRFSPKDKIRQGHLWQVNELEGPCLTENDLKQLSFIK